MTSSALVHRYASALVDVVTEPRSSVTPPEALAQLRSFDSVVRESHALRNVLESPAVSIARKRVVVDRLAAELGISRIPRNFLQVLVGKRRIQILHEILEAFDLLLDAHLGFVRADVRSAQPLPEGDQELLATELSRVAGRKVRLRFEVDPDLIGGVSARVGSTVYDGSVRGQLAQLSKRLTA